MSWIAGQRSKNLDQKLHLSKQSSYWHLAHTIKRKMCSELHLVTGLSATLFPLLLHITSILGSVAYYVWEVSVLFATCCINGDLYIVLLWVSRHSSLAGIRIGHVKRWPEICSFYANVCPSCNRKHLHCLNDFFCSSPWKKKEGSMVCVLCNHSIF